MGALGQAKLKEDLANAPQGMPVCQSLESRIPGITVLTLARGCVWPYRREPHALGAVTLLYIAAGAAD